MTNGEWQIAIIVGGAVSLMLLSANYGRIAQLWRWYVLKRTPYQVRPEILTWQVDDEIAFDSRGGWFIKRGKFVGIGNDGKVVLRQSGDELVSVAICADFYNVTQREAKEAAERTAEQKRIESTIRAPQPSNWRHVDRPSYVCGQWKGDE